MFSTIKYCCVISGAMLLASCTGATKLPQPDKTTAELLQARQAVYNSKEPPYIHGRKVEANPDYRDYTYQAGQQLDGHFQYLPNPTLTMYIFQHLTPDGAPVPGYPTMFKLYSRDHFALPGELTGNDSEPAEPVAVIADGVKSSDGKVVKSRFGNIGK